MQKWEYQLVSDTVVKIYLFAVILGGLLFALLYGVFWFMQRQRPRHPLVTRKLLWRQLFSFLSGLVAWYLFSSHLLSNSLVMLSAVLMLLISYAASEVLGRKTKSTEDSGQ